MSVYEKMTAIADAIRSRTGGTEPLTLDQMATQIAEIQAGGGGLTLLFETSFTLDESIVSGEVTVATIETGLELERGDNVLAVIACVNDTDTDTSYNHFRARIQSLSIFTSLSATTPQGGTVYSAENVYGIGTIGPMYISAAGQKCQSIKIISNGAYPGYGKAPSGDYSVRLYFIGKDTLGLEGI